MIRIHWTELPFAFLLGAVLAFWITKVTMQHESVQQESVRHSTRKIQMYTVAALPALDTIARTVLITDGQDPQDCFHGGGNFIVPCTFNGHGWQPMSSGGGGK